MSYLTQDDIDEMRQAAIRRRRRSELFQDWPRPAHCEVRTFAVPPVYCPNLALYVIYQEGREPSKVCDLCSHAWVYQFTKRGPVTIERL